jgi:hypothetical protein
MKENRMKKLIISEVVQLHGNTLLSNFYAIRQVNNQIEDALTLTLLDFVMQCDDLLPKVDAVIKLHEAGEYSPQHPHLPDWGINDINLWLRHPMAEPGHVCITNENTDYSSDEEHGQPQQFTYAQFRAAMNHWRAFQELVAKHGKESLVGQRFEVAWPEA